MEYQKLLGDSIEEEEEDIHHNFDHSLELIPKDIFLKFYLIWMLMNFICVLCSPKSYSKVFKVFHKMNCFGGSNLIINTRMYSLLQLKSCTEEEFINLTYRRK